MSFWADALSIAPSSMSLMSSRCLNLTCARSSASSAVTYQSHKTQRMFTLIQSWIDAMMIVKQKGGQPKHLGFALAKRRLSDMPNGFHYDDDLRWYARRSTAQVTCRDLDHRNMVGVSKAELLYGLANRFLYSRAYKIIYFALAFLSVVCLIMVPLSFRKDGN